MSPRSRYWGRHGVNVSAWVALLVGVAVCLLTINAPSLDGPLSKALDGADFTWTLGPLASAGAYWALCRRRGVTAGPVP